MKFLTDLAREMVDIIHTQSSSNELAELLVQNEEIIHNLANNLVSNLFDGKMRVPKSGIGDDFFQYRQLNDGEAASKIDWRISAKTNNLYTKEKQVLIPNQFAIWLDNSAQMKFISDTKLIKKFDMSFIYANAFEIALRKLGAQVFVCGQKNGGNFVGKLLQSGINFPQSFKPIPTLIISDGLRTLDFWQNFFALASKSKAQIFLIIINDKSELEFDFSGNIEFQDFENQNEKILIDDCENIQSEYKNQIKKHFDDLEKLIANYHFEFSMANNNTSLDSQIITIWHKLNLFLKRWAK